MTRTTFDRVKGVLVLELGVEYPGLDELTAETRLVEDLGLDSLDLVELELGIDEEFGIFLNEDMGGPSLEGARTVQDLVDLVERHSDG